MHQYGGKNSETTRNKVRLNRRGFDLESANVVKFFKESVVIKLVSIRGIGENELIAEGIREVQIYSV